ncbi:MAG: hypothetical protein COT71_01100 [Candidatus Andersenbacteria bacterium CG10_big_fil_rev_8_21_14_0_10_54_11]|uniref:Carboxypeptidase regulatory-like domain-containing protein n=1 Tax=Candidatus Andersenbacteria bacterium CG10_big_fil_rev_8_21_14_0_10_54_11 TaxID=1974485 RepID=A0A2M6WZY3_9BACT|nr:MAG: hypothetical protein COT71_01100 [Candidatus Andersenbacteria bacterium CG10_big_fil_rev_8_21_14_0_10_54_11]
MRGDIVLTVRLFFWGAAGLAWAAALPIYAQSTLPSADAGRDRTVSPGTVVVLDGRGSAGSRLVYTWRQLSGAPVQLQEATGVKPMFTAPDRPGALVFLLAVRNEAGQSATDTVTVAVRLPLERHLAARAGVNPVGASGGRKVLAPAARIAWPADVSLLVVSIGAVLISVAEHVRRGLNWLLAQWRRVRSGTRLRQRVRVVEVRSGRELAGVQVTVRSADGIVQSVVQTDRYGVAHFDMVPGAYLLGINDATYTAAPSISQEFVQADEQVYMGDYVDVPTAGEVRIVLPVQSASGKHGPVVAARRLRRWQFLQRHGHAWAWTAVTAGALLNTALLLVRPQVSFFVIALVYIVLVGTKLLLEARERPSYGIVRDTVTHLPLDLAVVRLYERYSGRLIMTRVTDGQGKFFALPPHGQYTLMVAREGFAPYRRDGVEIHGHDDSVQLLVELVPLVRPAAAALADSPAA